MEEMTNVAKNRVFFFFVASTSQKKKQFSDFSFISLSSRLGTDATKQLCACKLQVHQVFIGPIRSQGKLKPNLPFHQIQNLDFYL